MREPCSTTRLAGSRRSPAPRVAIYTHDTYGLGHVRRCVRIARAVARKAPRSSILLVTGTPALNVLDQLPANVDVVKIPTIVQTGPAADRPPHLRLPLQEITRLRSSVTASALSAFQPDVLLVDNFPLGSRRELEAVLNEHSERGAPALLGLRDIVDRPEVVRRTWARDGLYDVIERHYTRVLIYGRREIFDVAEAYGLATVLRDRLRYCGYVSDDTDSPSVLDGDETVSPGHFAQRARLGESVGMSNSGRSDLSVAVENGTRMRDAADLAVRFSVSRPVLIATAGGGGDGLPLLSAASEALTLTRPVGAVLVTGPLMSCRARDELVAKTSELPGVHITRHVPDLPDVMNSADVLITMAGYNTLAELARRGRRAIVVPRDWRYGEQRRSDGTAREWEQRLRAEAFERAGLVRVVMPETLTPESLARAIEAELGAPRHVAPLWPVGQRQGADLAADELLEVSGLEDCHARE